MLADESDDFWAVPFGGADFTPDLASIPIDQKGRGNSDGLEVARHFPGGVDIDAQRRQTEFPVELLDN